jgi:uncharacterized protein (DUF2267 family)
MNFAAVRAALMPRLDEPASAWLAASLDRMAADPSALGVVFPAAGRCCGRGHLKSDDPALRGWTVDDAVRVLLLLALPLRGEQLAAEVMTVYSYGDAAEKRGVLRALPWLPVGDSALKVVRDALRTNDTRLVAAALGPYAAEHLDDAAWRHGVLKCLFVGVPLAEVAGLERRVDDELARMVADYARERMAAGRAVPEDVRLVLDRQKLEA